MNEVVITVDVYCNWEVEPQAYRIYVDDDLLAERVYHWRNPEQYVQEVIVVNLDPGMHQFKLEPADSNFKGFRWQMLSVDGKHEHNSNGQFLLN